MNEKLKENYRENIHLWKTPMVEKIFKLKHTPHTHTHIYTFINPKCMHAQGEKSIQTLVVIHCFNLLSPL
jgi:hypothetical protein